MADLRVAVVGVGHLGKHHARLLREVAGVRLVAVADTRDEAREAAAAAYDVPAFADYRELEGRVDGVCVAVPTAAHREVAGFFLERGCDVLVEKPIAPTVEDGAFLVELAREQGRILQVGHIERFNPAFRAIRDMGIEPRYVEAQRLAPFTFRSTDIGVVLDLMIHDLDLVLSVIRSKVVEVHTFGGALFTPAEDMASAILKFENGAAAQLTATRVAMRPMRKMRLFSRDSYSSVDFHEGQGMTIRKKPGWDIGNLDLESVNPEQDLWKLVFEGLLEVQQYRLDDGNPLLDELTAFAHSMHTREAPAVDGAAGLAALAAAHQVLEAIARHPW